MRHILLLLLSCLSIHVIAAQETMNNNRIFDGPSRFVPLVGPEAADNSAYIDLKEGSPFFQEDWAKSTVITKDNSVFHNIYIRLNPLSNRIHFLDSNGRELLVGMAVEQLKIPSKSTGKTAHFINGSMLLPARKGWYQLLVNDTLTVLRGFKKSFEQRTSYGSATEYSIKTVETNFVIYNGQEYEVKKASDFTKVLPDKKALIEAHIKSLGKVSKDEQLVLTAQYCNTILM